MLCLPRLRCRLVYFVLLVCPMVTLDAPPSMPLVTLPEESSVPLNVAGGSKQDIMMELLGWATKHSDPERVKELVQKLEDSNLTIKDIYGQDTFDALFVDEANVMIQAIQKVADYKNKSLGDDELETALTQLQEMIEQVDNAGNLHTMGGLAPLLDLAAGEDRSADIRSLALWTFGVAAGNNQPVQASAKQLGAVDRFIKLLPRCGSTGSATGPEGSQYCGKLVFAISCLIRNDQSMQEEADRLGLFTWLLDFGVSYESTAVAKKSLGLLDICMAQSPELGFLESLSEKQNTIASTLTQHVRSGDVDFAEKGLRLINRFLSLRPFLFGPAFREELTIATKEALTSCDSDLGEDGAEVCRGLQEIAASVDLALVAREFREEEL